MRQKSRNGTTKTRYRIFRSDKAKSASVDTVNLSAVLVGLFVYWFKAAVLQASGSRLHAFELLLGSGQVFWAFKAFLTDF